MDGQIDLRDILTASGRIPHSSRCSSVLTSITYGYGRWFRIRRNSLIKNFLLSLCGSAVFTKGEAGERTVDTMRCIMSRCIKHSIDVKCPVYQDINIACLTSPTYVRLTATVAWITSISWGTAQRTKEISIKKFLRLRNQRRYPHVIDVRTDEQHEDWGILSEAVRMSRMSISLTTYYTLLNISSAFGNSLHMMNLCLCTDDQS